MIYQLPPGMVLQPHWLGIAVAQWPPLPPGAVALHYVPSPDPAIVWSASMYPIITKEQLVRMAMPYVPPPAEPLHTSGTATLSAPPKEASP
jgi:hypothetical protein